MTAALPPPPQTYTHPTPLTTLAPHLLPHLPTSLPLLRRLQFHTSSPSARIIATFPPSSSSSLSPEQPSPKTHDPLPFAAIWADRTRAPETECWIFSTYETQPLLPSSVPVSVSVPLPPAPTPTTPTPTSTQQQQEQQQEAAKAQCLALLAAVARLPATTPLVIVGSVNEVLLRLIMGGEEEGEVGVGGLVAQSVVSRDLGGERDDDDDDDDDDEGGGDEGSSGGKGRGGKGGKGRERVIRSISVPYCKWLIAPPSPAPAPTASGGTRKGYGEEEGGGEEEEGKPRQDDTNTGTETDTESPLPPGYAFSTIHTSADLRLTISRTQIPKTETTLAQLGNCCVRYTPPSSYPPSPTSPSTPTPPPARPILVAWAFLGPDGSLTSLHVEPPHRGLGLAKAVARRLLRSLADDDDDDEAGTMGFRPVGTFNVNMNDEGSSSAKKKKKKKKNNKNKNNNQNGTGACHAASARGWAHSDVAAGNVESAGVAKGLGGTEGWRVRWVGVDLRAVARNTRMKMKMSE